MRRAPGAAPAWGTSSRGLRHLVLAGYGALLLGCAGDASPDPPPEDALPAAWANAPASIPPGPPVDPAAWWSASGDPQLVRLVSRAAARNPGLAGAAQRVAAARAGVISADAGSLPGIAAAGNLRGQRRLTGETPGLDGVGLEGLPPGALSGLTTPRNLVTWQAGFDANWEPGLFGRARAVGEGARAALGEAEEDAAAARVSLLAEVARAYVELRAAERRAWLLAPSVASQRRLLELTRTRRAAGLASDLDVDRAASALETARAGEPQADLAAVRALHRLAVLGGDAVADRDLRTPPGTEPRLPSIPGVSTLVVPAELVRARPDLRRAERRVARAAADLGVARADLWPRLTLTGSLTATATVVGAGFSSPAGPLLNLGGGPAVSIPLLDWGARRAAIDARGAGLAEATLAYRQAVLEAVEEVETALAAVRAERERVERLAAADAAATRALRDAELLYRQGLTSFLDRLQAEVEALRVRLDLAGAQEVEAAAAIALHKALAGANPAVDGAAAR